MIALKTEKLLRDICTIALKQL